MLRNTDNIINFPRARQASKAVRQWPNESSLEKFFSTPDLMAQIEDVILDYHMDCIKAEVNEEFELWRERLAAYASRILDVVERI